MLNKLLITGAAGGLGQMVRSRLGGTAKSLRLSDLEEITPQGAHEEVMRGDLADAGFVRDLVQGCDGVLHLGGVSTENSFAPILNANIIGMHNLYDAAQQVGKPRMLFASSNHVIGYYPVTEQIDADTPPRPDGFYGVSKAFGEALATMYFHKTGQETAIVRIGSCFEEPRDHRMLTTWFSPDDFVALVARVFAVPELGCPVIYGVSKDGSSWWDNSKTAALGWAPEDSTERFRAGIEASVDAPDATSAAAKYQGGSFAAAPLMKD